MPQGDDTECHTVTWTGNLLDDDATYYHDHKAHPEAGTGHSLLISTTGQQETPDIGELTAAGCRRKLRGAILSDYHAGESRPSEPFGGTIEFCAPKEKADECFAGVVDGLDEVESESGLDFRNVGSSGVGGGGSGDELPGGDDGSDNDDPGIGEIENPTSGGGDGDDGGGEEGGAGCGYGGHFYDHGQEREGSSQPIHGENGQVIGETVETCQDGAWVLVEKIY